MGVNKTKLVVSHGGVKIYHSWKGARALTYWYALTPGYDAESGQELDFDIRELPERFTEGLRMEERPYGEGGLEREAAAHKEALKRAIDSGHDFLKGRKRRRAWGPPTATTGLTGLVWGWLERLGRWDADRHR